MRITSIELMSTQTGCKALVDVSTEDIQLARVEVENALQRLRDGTAVELTLKPVRKARSLDANALMWHCLSQIAKALNTDKWEVYELMLRRYTMGRHIACNPSAVDAVQRTFRTSERLDDVTVNGTTLAQLLVYVGSSDFDTEEMSHFIGCLIDEMKEMGLETPTPERTREVIKAYGLG